MAHEAQGRCGRPTALVEMKRAAASGAPYALVLSDALMPGMDGFTLIEQIKQHPELPGPRC